MSDSAEVTGQEVTAGPFLREKLLALDARVREAGKRVVSDPSDDEAVHDLRVAIRRMRTVLEIARPVLGRFFSDQVRLAFRDVHRATGALRDEEVILKIATHLKVAHPDMLRWLEVRGRRERRLRRGLIRRVQKGELESGHLLLAALLAFPTKPSRDVPLARFARRAVQASLRGVHRRRDAHPDDVIALHQLRIAYKRLRYAVETFGPALPADLEVLAQPAASFQARLGDIHDVDMTVACVRRARALSPDARSVALEALARERAEHLRAYAEDLARTALAPTTPPMVG
jgi:CHAD domain-containing protein